MNLVNIICLDINGRLDPTHLGGWTPMGGHLILTAQYQMSLPHLGGWTPMVGHLILTGQYHLSPTHIY